MRRSLQSEIAAAQAVARKVGLGACSPKVLKVGKHTSLRLGEAPVVARMAPATSASVEALARELQIGRHLAHRNAPAVRPTSLVEPGPHSENGYAVTLWDFADGRSVEGEADEQMAAEALQLVHDGLKCIEADLPLFSVAIDSVAPIYSDASIAPKLGSTDRLFLSKIYARFRSELACWKLVLQPIHGDAHLGNVLVRSSGATWMDLEAISMGP